MFKTAIGAANGDTLDAFSVGVDAGGKIAIRHWASEHQLTQVRLLSRGPPTAATRSARTNNPKAGPWFRPVVGTVQPPKGFQLSAGRIRPAKKAIPYTSEALRHDVQRVRDAWADCQATRDRNAIYAYLSAVYGLVAWWTAEGREIDRARRALCLCRLEVSDREDPFASIIRCTADPVKADNRTRSKWSRVLRYAWTYKPESEPLDQFIKGKGGINACAARFSRRIGRGAPR